MIWRSNITVWNSHDVLLLLFTSTLGVIIEVNIFYTNTIPCGLSFIEVRPESKQQTFTLCFWFWWCPEGSQGWFGGICVWQREENLFFVYQFLSGVCVCFHYLKYWTVRCSKCSVKSKSGHSSCSQCEVGTQLHRQKIHIWGQRLPRGIVLSTTATYQLIKKEKKCQLPEAGNALDSEMKMSKNFPRYLTHCLFLQILYRKINSSFSALWGVPINTLSIYRVRSLVRSRCWNLSVGLCFQKQWKESFLDALGVR